MVVKQVMYLTLFPKFFEPQKFLTRK